MSLFRNYSVVCGIAESVVILFISNLDMGRQADYGNDFNAPLQLEASKAKKGKKLRYKRRFFSSL